MRIGVIGCGNIASAVVHGIANDGHQITVSERSERYSKALSEAYANVTVASNQAVADASEIIFLGLLADRAPEVLGAIQFREGQQIISFMAGATLSQADQLVLPAHAVALMMPFPGIAEGGSPIIVKGNADLVRTVFGAHNSIFALLNSSEMAAYLCAQATLLPGCWKTLHNGLASGFRTPIKEKRSLERWSSQAFPTVSALILLSF